MFDLGWSEMLVIGVLTLLIMGPKDLPKVFKQVSSWLRYARGLARDFQSGVDDMVREADLEEAKDLFDQGRKLNPKTKLKDLVDPKGAFEREIKDTYDRIHDDDEPWEKPIESLSDKGEVESKAEAGVEKSAAAASKPKASPKASSKTKAQAKQQTKPKDNPRASTKAKSPAKPRTRSKVKSAAKPKAPAKPQSAKSAAKANTGAS